MITNKSNLTSRVGQVFSLPFCGEGSVGSSASPHFDLSSFVKPLASKQSRNGEHMTSLDC